MTSLQDKTIVISGAAGGIGRAVSWACARAGARVLLNDNGADIEGASADSSVAVNLASELIAAGHVAFPCTADIATDGGPAEVIASALEHLGAIDGLVCCAGVQRDRPLLRMDDDDFDRVMNVQLRATFRLVRNAARAMVDRGQGGAIVTTTGSAAFFGSRRQVNLCAASAAVVGLTRGLAVELQRHSIRVNAVAPVARTRATEQLPMFENMRADSMTPEHVAPVVVFLLSDLAAALSGEVVGAAGGRIYSYRTRETAGAFLEGAALSAPGIAQAWNDIYRGPASS
jgi:NAD(P)-dependent dehydrogenase (short-subunit alcohol dehydrogenase family)